MVTTNNHNRASKVYGKPPVVSVPRKNRTGDYCHKAKAISASDPRLIKCTGVCGKSYVRRELGICFGGLRCQQCWPEDVDGRVSVNGNGDGTGGGIEDVSFSSHGFKIMTIHEDKLAHRHNGKGSDHYSY